LLFQQVQLHSIGDIMKSIDFMSATLVSGVVVVGFTATMAAGWDGIGS
jgi:hypothetical protein